MWRRLGGLAGFFIGLSVLMSVPAAAAGSTYWGTVRGWTVAADDSLGGCFIYSAFEGNAHVRIGYDRGHDKIYLILGDKDWKSIEVDKKYQLQLQMGHKPKWTAPALGGRMDDIPILYAQAGDITLLKEIASQNYMRVWYGTTEIANFSLKGTAAALSEMVRCQTAQNKKTTQGGDPFSSGASDPFGD